MTRCLLLTRSAGNTFSTSATVFQDQTDLLANFIALNFYYGYHDGIVLVYFAAHLLSLLFPSSSRTDTKTEKHAVSKSVICDFGPFVTLVIPKAM
jgi:hypothetical protein